jgi:adenylate cyclase, class 2
MSDQEIEVKISIEKAELERIRADVHALGFERTAPRKLERNTLFDFPDGQLARQGSALRLRRYGEETILTYKGPQVEDPELKIREEIETGVEDSEALERILKRVGLSPSFHYAKQREKFVLARPDGDGVSLCIDETPFGCFVEIEAASDDIRDVAKRLGWSKDRFITRNYVDLYAERGLGT